MGAVVSRAAIDDLDSGDKYATALAAWAESLRAWHVEFAAWDDKSELRRPPQPPNTSRWSTKITALMEHPPQREAAYAEASAIVAPLCAA